MPKRDYYEVLGVSRDADADEIKKAFRRLAREQHPDVNPDPVAGEQFRETAEAYEVLSSPESRARYDRFGHAGVDGSTLHTDQFMDFGSLTDLLGAFFGDDIFGGPRRAARGADASVVTELTLSEAAFGVTREVEVEIVGDCDECNGSGAAPGTKAEQCATCGGAGRVQQIQQTPIGQFMRAGACPACRGRGVHIASPCRACRGNGRRQTKRSVEVSIPAGIMDGQQLKMRGQGHAGPQGSSPGDLYVGVAVKPDPRFIRDGSNLVSVLDVPFTDAALGAELEVETLEGNERIELEPGTQPGDVVVLRGKGIPHLQGRGRGDQLVQVNVLMPRKLTDDQRRLLHEFQAGVGEDTYAAPEDGSFLGRIRAAFR